MNNKFEVISSMIENGFSIIELYGIDSNNNCTCYKGADCTSSGKHPVNKKWKENTISSKEELERILQLRPNANFGVVTTENLFVIDVDPRHDGLESLKKIYGTLPPTLTVKTGGGGYHFYYISDEEIRNRTGILNGIYIRGEGGFVVAPASKHKSGNYYHTISFKEVEKWIV